MDDRQQPQIRHQSRPRRRHQRRLRPPRPDMDTRTRRGRPRAGRGTAASGGKIRRPEKAFLTRQKNRSKTRKPETRRERRVSGVFRTNLKESSPAKKFRSGDIIFSGIPPFPPFFPPFPPCFRLSGFAFVFGF